MDKSGDLSQKMYLYHMIKLVILGAGNVATHLFKAFQETKNVEVCQVYNHREGALHAFHGKTQTTTSLQELVEADIYLISVKDDVVQTLAEKIPFQNKLIVHTSGSLPLLKTGSKNGVLYPLQTFSKEIEVDSDTISFCLEASDKDSYHQLDFLAKQVSPKVFSISTNQRKSLHLAAVFACNFVNYMYQVGEKICEENAVPFRILHGLMEETLRKGISNSPRTVQTGPAIRKDYSTINRHLEQLHDAQDKEIYTLISEGIIKNNL